MLWGETKLNLSLWQKIKLKILGYAYIGHRQKPGWKAPLPFYVVRCEKHGLFEDYPHGRSQYFLCPKCREEEKSDG